MRQFWSVLGGYVCRLGFLMMTKETRRDVFYFLGEAERQGIDIMGGRFED